MEPTPSLAYADQIDQKTGLLAEFETQSQRFAFSDFLAQILRLDFTTFWHHDFPTAVSLERFMIREKMSESFL